jgi:hypothetical protein
MRLLLSSVSSICLLALASAPARAQSAPAPAPAPAQAPGPGTKDAGSKDAGSKDAGSKDPASKDTASKDTAAKDTAAKDASVKDAGAKDAAGSDRIQAVQRRPLREANRLELWPYFTMSIADPYLQRVGGGLRALWHLREGAALGVDGSGLASFETEELAIARRELRARVIESRERMALRAVGSIAPLYGKVALPGDALVHFEVFMDAALGGAWTETDAGSGLRPLVGAGLGERLLLSSTVALTARVGGEVYAERVFVNGSYGTHAMGYWSVAFGLSFYFPGAGERP